jgi:hypothetical protein
MKFGVREICDVVLKAKANQKVGNKIFYKNEPVIYFDTLKTSTMEGAATTVYAQGGRGNSRLMAWEGERTVTFTMEDALISPAGFMILSGAGLVEADTTHKIKVHRTEQTAEFKILTEAPTITYPSDMEEDARPTITPDTDATIVEITLAEAPHFSFNNEDFIYVMLLKDGEVHTEPFIPYYAADKKVYLASEWSYKAAGKDATEVIRENDLSGFKNSSVNDGVVLVDYYAERSGGVSEITITPDKFGGYYYLEASTLFRNTDGVDMPAEFVIPNCKIQSNFSFSMASSGDPSTFTFTIDAFPDYTRFDKTRKVLAAIQIITDSEGSEEISRIATPSEDKEDANGMIYRPVSG